jgi:two-component system NtrC family sensor kinase
METAHHDFNTTHLRLLQQEKVASISQLAAGVAHEINNPLAYVISNLSALGKYIAEIRSFLLAQDETILNHFSKSSNTGADLFTQVKKLREAADIDFILEDIGNIVAESLDGSDRMKQIVQNLKSFTGLDGAGSMMVDLNQGLESTLKVFWNELKQKARVETSYGNLPKIRCNPSQLNLVFMNLLVNALQAIEHKGRIDIQTRREGELVFIAIADSGCGIPADHLNRIFEPFFTTKEVGKGTGLGLTIVYDIVKRHDGDIVVQSAPGEGTRFTIRLPLTATTR